MFDISFNENSFTIATSIAPKDIEKQKRAVDSWLVHGFQVVSFNEKAEAAELRPMFPGIQFIEVKRTGRERAGKPLVFFDDIIDWFRGKPGLGGFVNSDIILRPPSPDWLERLRGLCRESLVFCRRVEISDPAQTEGRFYRTGFDAYFFDPAILSCYPAPTEYLIGFPHWDYFMILMPILRGIPVRQLVFPYAYHVSHKQYYNVVRDGIPFGLRTFQYIASELDRIPDKDHLLLPLLDWFLKRQPNKAETPEEIEFYYTFLHVLDKFFLETIDRVSVKHGPLGEIMAQTPHHFHQVPEEPLPVKSSLERAVIEPGSKACTVSEATSESAPAKPILEEPAVTLSVVIPTFNRKEILVRCLDHIARQDLAKSEYEVIVVDDGSTDGTFDLRHHVSQPYRLRWLTQPNQGPAVARNTGISAARGQFVLFLNDDALLEPHVLSGHVEAHRRIADPAAAVLGRFSIHPDFVPHDTPMGYCIEHSDLAFDYCRMQSDTFYNYGHFYTCNISLRRDFILADAPFDPEFLRVGAEDIEYGYRLQQRGCKIYYQANLVAWHAHHLDPHGLGRMFVFRGKGGVVLFTKQNHLSHHTETMTPSDAERFRCNREVLAPVIDRLLRSLSKLGARKCRVTQSKPPTFEASNALKDYMYLWRWSDAQLRSVVENYADRYGKLERKLGGMPTIPIEQVAATLYPGLHFVKWWFDTCGVVDSPRLPDMMRLDSGKGKHAVATAAHPGRSPLHTAPARASIIQLPACDESLRRGEPHNGALPPSFSTSVPPAASIIILSLNQWEWTRACVESIRKHTTLPYEIVLVDNGSSKETVRDLLEFSRNDASISVILNAANKGFALGNNQGMALARGEHALLLNNDTLVTEGWLEGLLKVLADYPKVGIVGPMSNYVAGPQIVEEARYQSVEQMESFASRWRRSHRNESFAVSAVIGFCMLIRKSVIEVIGGLDPLFGIGNFEDNDFCYRGCLAGFEVRVARDVFIHHQGSLTFKAENIDYVRTMKKNWELFKVKWGLDPRLPMGHPNIVIDRERVMRQEVSLPHIPSTHDCKNGGKAWFDRAKDAWA